MNSNPTHLWKSRWLRWAMLALAGSLLIVLGFRLTTRLNWNFAHSIGEPLDSLDGVAVYYNGGVNQTHGRSTSPDGYNIGIRYQCVEFVKRYYLEVYGHRLPDAYGHAKDFFDPAVADGALNHARGLLQWRNGGSQRPQKGDLLVWKPSDWNPYGHVAIVAAVHSSEITVIQQNPGPLGSARIQIALENVAGRYRLADDRLLGWLRMP